MNIAATRLCVVFGVVQSGQFSLRNFKRNMCSDSSSAEWLSMMQALIPKLDPSLHKGEAGRIGVVGGSREYTGAPYFAAISALKVGCDLSHVFCMSEAAPVIKSYSPELIVHPILDSRNSVSDICQWLPRIHSLIVGPGLGREQTIFENTKEVILNARKMDIPIVIDADGLFYVTQYPDIVKGHRQITLTPNAMEFSRLYHSMVGTEIPADNEIASVVKVSSLLGNVTVVRKGKEDIISDGIKVLTCDHHGSYRRCGGQGDLLSGSMGTWTYWAHKAHKVGSLHPLLKEYGPSLCAGFAACWLTRECSRQAFAKYHRSTITSNMIDEIGPVMTAVEENL